ncbi:hypothetical protein LWC34_38975 [Kibdelosporangium philippinense]|uniref:Uncharacterized protein n=1 Tax=Kibdelosporangium philippinense TaxID=211113 RepID=A0ABS8ZMI7_9PSEU|nr:hypothetical protein [Kibdelosporangium philippinense]MCE7008754.1 hypothetical protein [Kibdelosporangium philippinense]
MADYHVIDIDLSGLWKLEHPPACPLDERQCLVHQRAEQIVGPDTKAGRFECRLGPLDELLIGREIAVHDATEPAVSDQSTAPQGDPVQSGDAQVRSVHLDLSTFPNPGAVLVDGVDIARAVSAVEVHADVHSVPHIVLSMPIPQVTIDGQRCHVQLHKGTRDALAELGWTPPCPETGAPLDFYGQRRVTKLALDLARRLLSTFTTGEKAHPGRPSVRTGWVAEESLNRWRELMTSLVADHAAFDPEHGLSAPGVVDDVHGTNHAIIRHYESGEDLCRPCATLRGELQRAGLPNHDTGGQP